VALAEAQVDIMALFGDVRTAVLNGFCPECGCPSPGPVREGQVVVCPACGCSYTIQRVLSEEGRAALEKLIGHVLERFERERARPLAEGVKTSLSAALKSYAERVLNNIKLIHERLGELPTKEDLEESLRVFHEKIIAYFMKLSEELGEQRSGLISVEKRLEVIEDEVSALSEEVRRVFYVINVRLEELFSILKERGLGLLPPELPLRRPRVWLAYRDMRGRKRIVLAQDGMIIGRSGLDVVVKDEEGRIVRKLGVQDSCVSGIHAMLVFSGGRPVLKVLTERKTNTRIGHKIGDEVVETVVQKGTYPLENGSVITLGYTRFEVICSD